MKKYLRSNWILIRNSFEKFGFACSFPVDQCSLICCWGRARSWGRTAWGCLGTCHGANRSTMLSWNREVSSQQCHTQWTYYTVCTVCSWYCLKRGPHQCIACTLVRIHPYIHPYIHTYVHTYIHTYMRTYVRMYVHTYVHTYVHAYVHMYVHPPVHSFIHSSIYPPIHPFVYPSIHTYIRTYMCMRNAL